MCLLCCFHLNNHVNVFANVNQWLLPSFLIYDFIKLHIVSHGKIGGGKKEILCVFFFFFNEFQGSWEKRILKSLNSMCTELSIPLAQKVMYSQLSVVKLMFFWKISLVLYACNIVFILHMVIKSCKTGIQVILAQNKFQRLWQCLLELNLRELYRQIFLCCCTN